MRPAPEALESRLAPATFLVNTTADTPAIDLATGKDAAGNISLRSALQAANAQGGDDTIRLPDANAVYNLTNPVIGADNALTLELEVRCNLTLVGTSGGGANSTISTQGADRVLRVFAGSKVHLQDLSLNLGKAAQGGDVLNVGDLTLTDVTVAGGSATGSPTQPARGGAIYNAAGATLMATGGAIVGSATGMAGADGANGKDGADGGPGGNGGSGQIGTAGSDGVDAQGGAIPT